MFAMPNYTETKRTTAQNAAMHLYFTQLAERLNDAGLDQQTVLAEAVSLPWTKVSVKENLWKTIQRVMLAKDSTTEMNTKDPQEIYRVLDRFTAEKFGITVPWPERMDGTYEYIELRYAEK